MTYYIPNRQRLYKPNKSVGTIFWKSCHWAKALGVIELFRYQDTAIFDAHAETQTFPSQPMLWGVLFLMI